MSYKKIRTAESVRYSPGATGATVSTVAEQLSRIKNVRDYGAVGDGVTDDTTALQNAMNALNPGETLDFPWGRYVITATLDLGVSGVLLRSTNTMGLEFQDGSVAHIIMTNASTTGIRLVTYTGTQTVITPSAGTGTTNTGVTQKPTEITIDGLQFHNRSGSWTGNNIVGIDATVSSTTLTVRNCAFMYCNKGIIGDNSGSAGVLLIEGNQFVWNDLAPITSGDINTRILNNNFKQCGPISIPPAGGGSVVLVSQNVWEAGTDGGVLLSSDSNELHFTDNIVSVGGSVAELQISTSENIIIADNTLQGEIQITVGANSGPASITGNIIDRTGSTPKMIEVAGDNNLIANNIMTVSSASSTGMVNVLGTANNTQIIGNMYIDNSGNPVSESTAVADAGTNTVIGTVGETGATGEIGVTGATGAEDLSGDVTIGGSLGVAGAIPNGTWEIDVGGDIRAKALADVGATIKIDSGTSTSKISTLTFADRGTDEWSIFKNAANDFAFFDSSRFHTVISIISHASNGNSIRIENGNVGIGGAPGSFQLDVFGSIQAQANITMPTMTLNKAGTDEWLLFSSVTTGAFGINGLIGGIFPFRIDEDAIDELVTLHASGLGINDTSPTRMLDVNGTGHFVSLLEADGGIDINGAVVNSMGVTTLGATGEITTEDLVACTTGGITVTLPVAATAGSGKVVYIKDRDGNASGDNITIEGNGSETIDGALTFVINVNYQAVTLVTDGSNWMTV